MRFALCLSCFIRPLVVKLGADYILLSPSNTFPASQRLGLFMFHLMATFITSPFQAMNPAAPTWHPKKAPVKGFVLPLPHYGFRPLIRARNTSRHELWFPPGYRGGSGYWNTNQNLAHCYS